MARPLRIFYPGAYYHVMNRGAAKQNIFHTKIDHCNFLACTKAAHEMFNLRVHAFCLMPNHYHLLVSTPDANLDRSMRHINGTYTQRYNKAHHRDGPLLRGRYKAILVENNDYLASVSRYIHLNPVSASLCKRAIDYKWSSYSYFLSTHSQPDWHSANEVLELFDSNPTRDACAAQIEYIKFMEEGLDEKTRLFYERARINPIFGSKAFIDSCSAEISESSSDHCLYESRLLTKKPSAQKIIDAVAKHYALDSLAVILTKRKNNNIPRDVAMYIMRYKFAYLTKTVAQIFDYTQTNSACARLAKVRQRVMRSSQLLLDIDNITRELR